MSQRTGKPSPDAGGGLAFRRLVFAGVKYLLHSVTAKLTLISRALLF